MSQMRYLRRGGLLVAALALAGGAAAACGTAQGAAHDGAARQASDRTAGTTTASTTTAGLASAETASPAGGAGKHASMLNGVSCAGRECFAVGSWYDKPPSAHALAEVWNGTSWRLESSPDGPTDSALAGVSCASRSHGSPQATDCLAVGSPVLAMANADWRLVAKTSDLDAVSCVGSGSCVAVGAEPSGSVPLFATWNGKTLRAGRMHATPRAAQSVTVAGVSCPRPDNCIAVGNYSYGVTAQPGPSARDQVLAEQWNGRSWRLLPAVNVAHMNELTAVSCASATECTAVGSSSSGQFPLVEQWNGSTWRVESAPTVSSIGYAGLTGVSCPAAAFCVASGTYQGTPIAETWNGKKWRIAELPQPAVDNHSAQLLGVSCTSKSSCVAVGWSGSAASYAEVLIDGRWHLSATRNPA
jgi:hypothetical protein